jgi:hypothetical protein
MEYCPYCAEQLTKPYKVCPYCKKSLDTELLKQIYRPGKSSKVDHKLKLKQWYREKSFLIYPVIALIIGFLAGAFLFYGYAQIQFSSQRSQYKQQIAQLQQTISSKEEQINNSSDIFRQELATKDSIIQILTEQTDILNRLIYFTRRLTSASNIALANPDDIDFYRRNSIYLISLFEKEKEKLSDTGYQAEQNYNLQTIPQFLE